MVVWKPASIRARLGNNAATMRLNRGELVFAIVEYGAAAQTRRNCVLVPDNRSKAGGRLGLLF